MEPSKALEAEYICQKACHATHKPYIELVHDETLEFCTRCHGGEVELIEKTCDERVLIKHLKLMLDCIDNANPGAFTNGVTDPSGSLDEGEVMTYCIGSDAREVLKEIAGDT